MLAQQMNVDVIANNLANMTTTGFKRQRIEFQDLMYQNVTRPGTSSSSSDTTVPSGLQLGLGVKPIATYRIHTQGSVQLTDSSLDLAINGEGFLQIELPGGEEAYTRAGSLQLNQDGEIVTNEGFRVEPGITVPDDITTLEINQDGQVLGKIPDQAALVDLGRLDMVMFINPAGLEAVGSTNFTETEASGSPIVGNPGEDNFGTIIQGALEQSNVDSVKEITNMITAQRAYEMNSQVISTSDEMMGTITQLR
jgi:flagellar basal-body rod protein FlgG